MRVRMYILKKQTQSHNVDDINSIIVAAIPYATNMQFLKTKGKFNENLNMDIIV